MLHGGFQVCGILNTLGMDSHCRGYAGDVEGFIEIHADVLTLRRVLAQDVLFICVHVDFEHPVYAVVAYHIDDRDVSNGGSPQTLYGHHSAAVSEKANHRFIRIS